MTPDDIIVGGVYLGRAGRGGRMDQVRTVTAIVGDWVTWLAEDGRRMTYHRDVFARWARSRLR